MAQIDFKFWNWLFSDWVLAISRSLHFEWWSPKTVTFRLSMVRISWNVFLITKWTLRDGTIEPTTGSNQDYEPKIVNLGIYEIHLLTGVSLDSSLLFFLPNPLILVLSMTWYFNVHQYFEYTLGWNINYCLGIPLRPHIGTLITLPEKKCQKPTQSIYMGHMVEYPT